MTFHPPDWSAEDHAAYDQRNARIDELVQERLAMYRSTNVKVFDMFIDPDDVSDGEPTCGSQAITTPVRSSST